jgi:hypothetical protein
MHSVVIVIDTEIYPCMHTYANVGVQCKIRNSDINVYVVYAPVYVILYLCMYVGRYVCMCIHVYT